jgi:pimeloyl-ACP methyl ester carboxylesterase
MTVDMHFDQAGAGPAFVLLHAFPLDSRMWRHQIRDLCAAHRVLAPDLPGFGRSKRPEGNPSIEDFADAVVALCRAEGVERAAVAGCSMGGYIALAIARRKPDFLTALALVDTRAAADSQDVRRARYEMVERARHEGTAFLQSADSPLSPRSFAERPKVIEEIRAMMADATPVGVMCAQRAMATRKDARAQLNEIAVPTVVMHGDDDPIVSQEEAQAMAAAIPGAEYAAIPLAGHLPPIEQPELVTEALRRVAYRLGAHPA